MNRHMFTRESIIGGNLNKKTLHHFLDLMDLGEAEPGRIQWQYDTGGRNPGSEYSLNYLPTYENCTRQEMIEHLFEGCRILAIDTSQPESLRR